MKKERTSLRLIQIETIVDERFKDPAFNVTMLARLAGLSASYLHELFFIHWRVTPQRLIEIKRLNHAKTLLSMGKNSLKEVGIESGYGRYVTFRRAFKKFFGVNPSVYTFGEILEVEKKQAPEVGKP